MPAVCRVGDTISGTCSIDGPTTGVWPSNTHFVTDQGVKVILVGDTGVAACGHTFTASTGSAIAKVNGVAIHRIGDSIVLSSGGTGISVATISPSAVTTA